MTPKTENTSRRLVRVRVLFSLCALFVFTFVAGYGVIRRSHAQQKDHPQSAIRLPQSGKAAPSRQLPSRQEPAQAAARRALNNRRLPPAVREQLENIETERPSQSTIQTPQPAIPQEGTPGSLDMMFGTGGTVLTEFAPGNEDYGSATVVQPDGKIIVAGTTFAADFSSVSIAVARYNADGTFDTTFGTGGKVTPTIQSGSGGNAVALQPDGKILVGGSFSTSPFNTGDNFGVLRLNANGTPDMSFGANGGVMLDLAPNQPDFILALAVQPDGKIVAGGRSFRSQTFSDFGLARLLPNGAPDTTFGTNGTLITPLSGSAEICAVLLDSSNRIIAAGSVRPDPNPRDFALARYAPNGALDASFGTGGIVTTDFFGQFDAGRDAVMQPDGKIVMAGSAESADGESSSAALARYNSNGTLDSAFGRNGRVTHDNLNALAISAQPNGRLLVAGQAFLAGNSVFGVLRLNPAGTRDATFGVNGLAAVGFGNNRFDVPLDVTLQPDGKIVAAGYSLTDLFTFTGADFAVARFNGDAANSTLFELGATRFRVNENAGPLAYTVTRLGSNSNTAASVQVATQNGTALAGQDYTAVNTTLNFAAGETSKSFTVAINDDNLVEGNEDFSIVLSNPTNATLGGTAQTQAVILDNEQGCSYTVTPNSFTPSVTGGNITVNVVSQVACEWTSASNAPFVRVLGPGNGDGNGSALFAVARNPDCSPRMGTLTVAGQTVTINQANTPVATQPGQIDNTFNCDGITTSADPNSFANYAIVQPSGKIVANGGVLQGNFDNFLLSRFNADGTPDNTFGSSGRTIVNVRPGENYAQFLIQQTDGKIVSVGQADDGGTFVFDFALVRYTADGARDASFGTAGVVTTDFGANDIGYGVAQQSDGKLVAFGISAAPDFSTSSFAMARYNTDGTLDTMFGNGGKVLITIGAYAEGYAVRIQPDGKIVTSGLVLDSNFNFGVGFARFNPNGTLDNTFGTDGKVITDLGGSNGVAFALLLQPDGRIVAGGYTNFPGTGSDFALVRLLPNGTLDGAFGTQGRASADAGGFEQSFSMVLQSNGKIAMPGSSSGSYATARFNPNGTLDNTYGTGGKTVTPLGRDSGGLFGAALQGDGKIIGVGDYRSGFNRNLAVARYTGDAVCAPAISPMSQNFPSNGGSGTINLTLGGGCGWTASTPASWITLSQTSGNANAAITYTVAPNPAGTDRYAEINVAGQTYAVTQSAGANMALPNNNLAADESAGYVTVTVSRTGNLDGTSQVSYALRDGSAKQRTDFTTLTGILTFSPGQSEGSFTVIITNDNRVEGDETLTVELSNPVNGTLGDFSSATMTLRDDDTAAPTANPSDNAGFFVTQHYSDFLSRVPDGGGFNYWTGQLNACGTDAACLHQRRIGVSAAFFVELEFQETGSVVYRLYRAAFGVRPAYREFMADRSRLVGGPQLPDSQRALAQDFARRPTFLAYYPDMLTNEEYANRLFDMAGLVGFAAERAAALAALNQGRSRSDVLLDTAELPAFKQREYNPAFVLMQYYGYLRRDYDQAGYDFWLNVLNQQPNNFRGMVCAFLTSREYQERFSSVVSRSNNDCN